MTMGRTAEQSGEGMPTRVGTDRWREPAARVVGTVVSLGAFWSVLSVVFRGAWRQFGEDLFGLVNLPVGPSLSIVDGAALIGVSFTTRTGSLLGHFSTGERSDLIVSVVAAVVLIPLLIAL